MGQRERMQRATLIFCLIWLALPWVWTFVMLAIEPDATVSAVTRRWARRYPLVAVALGAMATGLLFHWFHEGYE